jgi:hypothetical protein
VNEEAMTHWGLLHQIKEKPLPIPSHVFINKYTAGGRKILSMNVMVALLAYLVQIQSRRHVSSPFPVVLLNPYM